MNLHLKMYHVWLLVGNTGRLHEWRIKLKTEISARFFFFFFLLVYATIVSTGGSKLCKYMLLRLLNIKMFSFRIFFVNIATGTG